MGAGRAEAVQTHERPGAGHGAWARTCLAGLSHTCAGRPTARPTAAGGADAADLALLRDLGQVMRDASICGLGQAASNPLTSVIKYFPEEFVPKEAAE